MAVETKIHESTTKIGKNVIPVAVEVIKKLSGDEWCEAFPGSENISDLELHFRSDVSDFYDALLNAGAQVVISSTLRPKERAYLMRYSWLIMMGEITPDKVPDMNGVNIQWVHDTEKNAIDAATAMVKGYRTGHLGVAPALNSEHVKGLAIDMTISWSGSLEIELEDGTLKKIDTLPRTGMNKELAEVGASHGVIKYNGRGTDRPHWSSTGR